ncbi:uncharacterized protein KY384_004107 [Bacidia gigantensis]|uniref:uncharacterized protein n=1 Tax=Bacidia gigantensis TaxID=2732470 RepID=UPI001D048A0C|nr:uncharacterized protein KY384_004107 [Bacidia gigantensis]KAG8530750.1 hypothetical protein KY384_004107 [Bacidia gigantensis]
MTAHNSSRIWETPSNPASSPVNSLNHDPSKTAQLPSIQTLTGDLPRNSNNPTSPSFTSGNRTSDPWGGSTTQSTRSSAYSSGGGMGYASSISSPQRASNTSQFGATSYPADFNSPTSAGAQASPGFASPQQLKTLSLNAHTADPALYRSSQHSDSFPPQESRRSSLGSQVNSGFGNLQINNGASSPYGTGANPSHSSIAASLQRERGIPQVNGIRNSGTGSIHQQQSPLSPLAQQTQHARTAPVIASNPNRGVYNAEKPTVGQPYAFPDPDMDPEPSDIPRLSRRNSEHGSLASSIITTDSKYPHGQHSLDDADPMPGTHHHSLNSKRISGTSGDGDSPETSTPYSRTPALRASHKLAERKRRTEMKHLFDRLRDQIPASHGSKSSKWEILTKASEHIKNLENSCRAGQDAQIQMQSAASEIEALRRENEAMRREHYHLQEDYHRNRPGTATTINGQPSSHPFSNGPTPQPMQVDPSRSLPPLTNGVQTSSMQGVQYDDPRR